MITINLFDYKRIVTEVQVQQRIVAAIAVALLGLVLVAGGWGLQRVQVAQQTAETKRIEKLVAGKKPLEPIADDVDLVLGKL